MCNSSDVGKRGINYYTLYLYPIIVICGLKIRNGNPYAPMSLLNENEWKDP